MQFCERENLIDLDDMGMSVLLELSDSHNHYESRRSCREGELRTSRGRYSMGNNSCCMSSNGYQKDFKISGQIGEVNQKGKLTFTSLEHQIQNGLRKEYPEIDILEAVIHAVSPGVKLRSYLEGKTDLILHTLKQILQAHYAEKDTTDLYQQSNKAVNKVLV